MTPKKTLITNASAKVSGLGTPVGDRNKYYFLRNEEFDYDQVLTAGIPPTDSLWLYPNQSIAKDISDGYDTRYLLSFGPFNIDPGQTLPLSFAYLAGEYLHKDPDNVRNHLSGDNYFPETYYEYLDFSDLGMNAVWASWVYDNPGVDTDSDGYAGKFRLHCRDSVIGGIIDTVSPHDTIWEYDRCDTIWYEGDGVPDFRGASPPPAPVVWVQPEVGRFRIRFNGLRSETTRDVFSGTVDFEGYRVYISRDERAASYSLLASYDIEDYNKYVYDTASGDFQLRDVPFGLPELRCLYGDSCNDPFFDPESYTRAGPYQMPGYDSVFYFEPQDHNRSLLGVSTPIRKVYPDQPYPTSLNPDSADASELTEDGYLKYFEYEHVVENLLPTVLYYVNVTAFDYGSPQSKLSALETSKTNNPKLAYPLPTVQAVEQYSLEPYVYPNPYRGDGSYFAEGFEGRDALYAIPDRMRRIHFANLPAKCMIRIHTLDGDLVREIAHDMNPDDPASSHDEWDLITRNTQMVVSGIYYWSVERENGETHMGKLVIIM
jgi:hypothetical protein